MTAQLDDRTLDAKRIILATHNDGKLREFRTLLEPFALDIVSAGELDLIEPVEDGDSFEANAYTKAFAAAQATGEVALSDDSGLCVEALDGQPGIHTADWAEKPDGSGRDFGLAMEKVEKALGDIGLTPENEAARRGYFCAVLCLCWPDGHAEYFRGEAHGCLVWPGRGDQGFGYDPVFKPDGYERTFGEMAAAEKHGWHPRDRWRWVVPPRQGFRPVRPCEAGALSQINHNVPTNGDDGSPGFGVYVHWPFCAAKCPYCDFNSHVRHSAPDQAAYAKAYEAEIAHMAALQPNRPVTSIFFGGGTPSLMQPETVATILNAILRHWRVDGEIEVTLEANPTSVDAGRFEGYRAAGVNRVSLGVQSLRDEELKFLGRLHDVAQARAAIRLARDVFPRMSFDLIYARPGQTLSAWREELEEALDMGCDHLSLYQLTIEEGTPFYDLHRKGRIPVPGPDHAAELYELTQDVTASAGLPAYEISNHARPGAESRHNLTYWRGGTWAGIGPGAHGRLEVGMSRRALSNERNPEAWRAAVEARGHALTEDVPLSQEEVGDELLLMGMRLREGVDPARYKAVTGHTLDPSREADLAGHGMVERLSNGRLRATSAGWLVLDAVIADLAA